MGKKTIADYARDLGINIDMPWKMVNQNLIEIELKGSNVNMAKSKNKKGDNKK